MAFYDGSATPEQYAYAHLLFFVDAWLEKHLYNQLDLAKDEQLPIGVRCNLCAVLYRDYKASSSFRPFNQYITLERWLCDLEDSDDPDRPENPDWNPLLDYYADCAR